MALERSRPQFPALPADLSRLDILAALPVAAYTTDAEGRITSYNEAAAELWARRPALGEERWCGSKRLLLADGRPLAHADSPLAIALRNAEQARGVELQLERPDGSRRIVISHPSVLRDAAGEVVGGINILTDVGLSHANAHLAAIVESSDDAIISKTLAGTITSWNKSAERLFGYSADEAIGQSILMLIPPERHDEEPGIIARISRGERIDHYETQRLRKDGTLIDLSITVSPVRNERGEVAGASKIARDVTEKKRADQQRDLLLNEIKHRVKNTLGTVQAIASQTFRQAPREERDAFGARIRALASAHDLLTHQDWERVTVRDVADRAIQPFQETGRKRLAVSGSDTVLAASKALLLAMVLHELATNAVKDGALSVPDGTIDVTWQESGPRLVLTWRESGGPTVNEPSHRGFGSNLIERALKGEQGHAVFDFRPEGLVCTLQMVI